MAWVKSSVLGRQRQQRCLLPQAECLQRERCPARGVRWNGGVGRHVGVVLPCGPARTTSRREEVAAWVGKAVPVMSIGVAVNKVGA